MSLFSRKKRSSQVSNLKHSGKRLLLVSGCMLSLFMLAPSMNSNLVNNMTGSMTAYAAEVQSPRWLGSGDRWQVSDNAGGYLKNCWFEDLDGNWYMLGAEDGSVMYAGLVTDNSTGKTYLLNTNHDGTYGRMLTVNGTYNVNGVNVYLEFNQSHDGSYGAITSGLSEARASGVLEVKKDTIPTDSSAPDGGSGGGATENQNTNDNQIDDNGLIHTNKPAGIGGSTSGNQANFHGQ